jgi:hypothetical protein
MIFELTIAQSIILSILCIQCLYIAIMTNGTTTPKTSARTSKISNGKMYNFIYECFQGCMMAIIVFVLEFSLANIGQPSKRHKSQKYRKHSRWKFVHRLIKCMVIVISNINVTEQDILQNEVPQQTNSP